MRLFAILAALLLCLGCKDLGGLGDRHPEKVPDTVTLWAPYNDSAEVAANRDHEIARMQFRLLQSRFLDKNEVFRPLYPEVSRFSEAEYQSLKPLVLEQDIPPYNPI